jgi:hypothetical protein
MDTSAYSVVVDSYCEDQQGRLQAWLGHADVSSGLVDLDGFEPSTSSMPWKRAPNCATGPTGVFTSMRIAHQSVPFHCEAARDKVENFVCKCID